MNIAASSTKTLLVIIVLTLATLACGLPGNLDADAVAAAVEQTVQAAQDSGAVPATVQVITPVSASAQITPTPPATPTGQPTQAANSNDLVPPAINNVSASGTQVYSQRGCGTTTVTFTADVTDNSNQIAQVWMNYQFLGHGAGIGGNQWFQENLYSARGLRYTATIDASQNANRELQGNAGTLQYQIFAMDAAGNIRTEPDGYVYGVEVLPCSTQGNSSSGSNSAGISISNIVLYPDTSVYYGPCTTEETGLNVQATIDPLAEIASATVHYGYSSQTGFYDNYTSSMYQLGIGDYAGDIDAGSEAPPVLGTDDGSIEFYISVVDKNGQTTDSVMLWIDLKYCQGGVLGPPPQGATEPDIRYFTGPASANAGDLVLLEWDVWDACKVFLDGVEVQPQESYVYGVPANASDTFNTHVLSAWGASCDNSSEKWVQHEVQITGAGGIANPGGNNPGAGNGVVRFYNNSSHPVVELIIDGVEVILAENQTILTGGYLDVTVSAGFHNYQVGNGFWNTGKKVAIYPLPAGGFDAQDGSATIIDPSIVEMLTHYGQGGYYAGEFWNANNNIQCAAFDFYTNNGFDFYVDGGYNDSGYYSLISRDPGSYTVTFEVENAAGTESFMGTYSYTGAFAGTMHIENGPDSWKMIEYVWNGGCP
jgi:hypothetical protein